MKDKTRKFWILADPHLLSNKMTETCGRPKDFSSRIYKGLASLQKDDTLICLGDLCKSTLQQEVHDIFIAPLVCKKILVRGNHDHASNTWYLNNGWDFVCDEFSSTYFKKKILFSHKPRPIRDYDYCINGHFHNCNIEKWEPELTKHITPKHVLVSCEETGYRPINLKWLVEQLNDNNKKL